jgi:hypothetical protein
VSAPSAHLSVGGPQAAGLYRIPVAVVPAEPGQVAIILGTTMSGLPVILTATSLEWLDDLAEAVAIARARGIVQAGMTAVLP